MREDLDRWRKSFSAERTIFDDFLSIGTSGEIDVGRTDLAES